MHDHLLEDLTKFVQALNLAKQDATEANKRADTVVSIILVDMISEVAKLEAKANALLSAALIDRKNLPGILQSEQ
jgi:hypothetical protein